MCVLCLFVVIGATEKLKMGGAEVETKQLWQVCFTVSLDSLQQQFSLL